MRESSEMPVECRLPGCTIAVNAQRQAASERRGEGEPVLDRWSASSHPRCIMRVRIFQTSRRDEDFVPWLFGVGNCQPRRLERGRCYVRSYL
jgi:hypothetical protein